MDYIKFIDKYLYVIARYGYGTRFDFINEDDLLIEIFADDIKQAINILFVDYRYIFDFN